MKTLLLIDAHALIHRSFHALPPLSAPDGRPVGALYGLSSTLIKLLSNNTPDYAAGAFDRPEPTFRKQAFAEYKAHRPPAVDELIEQIVAAHKLFQTFGIPTFEKPGYEADDIIGTFAKRFASDDLHVVILTGDLDTLQLVDGDRITVRAPKRGVTETVVYDEQAVRERFNLSPRQLVDYKGLVGDQSDNIPGVAGIGPKTASALLSRFGTIEDLITQGDETYRGVTAVLAHKKEALFSKQLATIDCNVPLSPALTDLSYPGFNRKRVAAYFETLGFQSLLRRIGGTALPEPTSPLPDATDRAGTPEPPHLTVADADDAREKRHALSSNTVKVAYQWKPVIAELAAEGIGVADPIFDLSIAGWLLDPDQGDFSLPALTKKFIPREKSTSREAVIDALYRTVARELRQQNLVNVAERIEMPLIRVLAAMERAGIAADREALDKLSRRIGESIDALSKRIFALAGTSFNLNSPRQVSDIVFERLKLKTAKTRKTSTGQRRTGRDVLEALADQHPIIPLILEYREGFKIKSSFVDPIRDLLGADGRIHTTFTQTGTGTGRLSSEKPNLQNIPQESRWASELRRAFVAPRGFQLLTLDYSQLELRLLAHLTADPGLLAAFRGGHDIHTTTAAKIFGVDESGVTKDMRRVAKTLNFGVVFGMGVRAFSETSGLSRADAERFIANYFSAFPTIKAWQEKQRLTARQAGYVENANGRRRWFSRTRISSGEFDRAAMNMPLQSLEADILKLAMIDSYALLRERGWLENKARLVLSIHDELLFEVADGIVGEIAPALQKLMESTYPLSVPLRVDLSLGRNWGELRRYLEYRPS